MASPPIASLQFRGWPVKEISGLKLLGRFAARFAALTGLIALVIWITWVMLDLRHLQSGFTLP